MPDVKMHSLVFGILICLLSPAAHGAEFQGPQLSALPGTTGVQTLNISEDAAETISLQRTETEAATVVVTFMTVQEFSSRNTSAPGSCQAALPPTFSEAEATAGDDFTSGDVPVSFAAGEATQSLAVGALDDATSEAMEVFVAVIASPNAMTNCALLIRITDNDVTTFGFIGLGANPQYELIEGEQREVCVGRSRGEFTIESNFVELDVALVPTLEGTDNRLDRTEYIAFDFTIGPVPNEIQLAMGFEMACYTATAVDNDVVDGDVFYNMTIAPTARHTLALMLPVVVEHPQATIIVRDNDRNNFTVSLESTETGTGPSVYREGTQQAVTTPYILRRQGLTTDLTYIITLGTVHDADFIFEPIRFEPSTTTLPLSFRINDDTTPENRESFAITIESISFADGREGVLPQISGMVEVEIYDNDFAVGFSEPDLRVTEGTMRNLDLSILDPTGGNIDPEANLSLTLVLQRLDSSPGDDTLVMLQSSSTVQLTSAAPSVQVQLTVGDDDVCSSHRYLLSYTYTGSSAYTVLTTQRGEVAVELMDTAEDCVVTTTSATTSARTPHSVPSTQDPQGMTTSDPQGTNLGGTVKPRESAICIPCIVVPIVLILLFCCCFWWLLIIFCFVCKPKCCRWYHDYDPQKKERAYEGVVSMDGKMIPVTEAT